MIDLNVCVICGSSENLNTSMTINVDGKEATVKICDTDADTATPKIVKERYLDKKSEIDEIIAKAKQLGLEVNIPDDAGAIATFKELPSLDKKPEQPEPATKSVATTTPKLSDPTKPGLDPAFADAIDGSEAEGVLSTQTVDGVSQRIRGASGGESGAESHMAYVPGSGQDKLDPTLLEGKVKMEAGQGRGGQPIAIPAIRVDHTGTTIVRVKQDIDDNILQRRFKEFAGSDSTSAGYNVHNCPICKGDGMIKQRGKIITCPKCDGTGLLNS
jgi:hypothetical protein